MAVGSPYTGDTLWEHYWRRTCILTSVAALFCLAISVFLPWLLTAAGTGMALDLTERHGLIIFAPLILLAIAALVLSSLRARLERHFGIDQD